MFNKNKLQHIGLTLGSFLLVHLSAGTVLAGDWPHYRGPDRNGFTSTVDLQTDWASQSPKKLWQAQVGVGFSSITVADGKAYTMGWVNDQDVVSCLDLKTGQTVWTHTYKAKKAPKMYDGGPNATPELSDGRVFTLGKQGQVHCLDAQSGKVLWHVDLKQAGYKEPSWGFTGGPMVWKDTVYINAGESGVALKAADGSFVWRSGNDKTAYAVPQPFEFRGQPALAIMAKNTVEVVDPASGRVYWNYGWKTSWDVNAAEPVVVGQTMFLSSGYNKGGILLDFSGQEVREIWKSKGIKSQCSGAVLIDGHLYGLSGDVKKNVELVCMNYQTGQVVWEQKGFHVGAVVGADGHLLVLDGKGTLVLVEATPAGYREKGRLNILNGTCWTPPALAHGKLLARNSDGNLVCYQVGS